MRQAHAMLELPNLGHLLSVNRCRPEAQGTATTGLDLKRIVCIYGRKKGNESEKADVFISEKKIDLIVHRLAGVERALHDLKSSSGATPVASASSTTAEPYSATPSQMTRSVSSTAVDQQDPSPAFEGLSSFSAQSAYASEFLETAMSRGPTSEESPKIAAALSTLKHIVRMQSLGPQHSAQEVRFPSQKCGPRTTAAVAGDWMNGLKMPPMEAVIALLRRIRENPNCTTFFGSYCSFMSLEEFTEKCREVYFCTEAYSPATFIIVNCGLYNLFLELSFTAKDCLIEENYQAYLRLCKYNTETALASLKLLVLATKEIIQALTLGVRYSGHK